jgi:hypothetical protein
LFADLLSSGVSVRLEVGGHSMAPFVRSGDVVTVAPRGDARPSLGDVVVCAVERDQLTMHRVVGWTGGQLVPRGDAAPTADAALQLDSVVGLVRRVERRGRPVRLGLGPERRVIAWLSRLGLLASLGRLRARLVPGGQGAAC